MMTTDLMNIADLERIAQIAEDKRVRVELHPHGFLITARAPIKGKGMVEVKQIIEYAYFHNVSFRTEIFETIIDKTIEKLKQENRSKR